MASAGKAAVVVLTAATAPASGCARHTNRGSRTDLCGSPAGDPDGTPNHLPHVDPDATAHAGAYSVADVRAHDRADPGTDYSSADDRTYYCAHAAGADRARANRRSGPYGASANALESTT